jgi:hypothetical protein
MTIDGRQHTKRVAAGEHLQRLLGEVLGHTPPESTGMVHEVGNLGGLAVTRQAITTIDDEVRLAVPDAHVNLTYPVLDWKRAEPSSLLT